MPNVDTFVINYDPIEGRVNFAIIKSSGVNVGIDNGEPLKDFENTDGIFNLEGQHEKIFTFIRENFDGKSEVALKIEIPQRGYNKRESELERFKEYVNKFNDNSDIKISLGININRLAPIEEPVPIIKEILELKHIEERPIIETAPPVKKPTVRVAVVGKISSGKTELIKGLTKYNNSTCDSPESLQNVTKYYDIINDIEWYEIDSIQFGKTNVAKTRDILDRLICVNKVTIVLYCLNAKTGKIEDIERDFIVDVKQKHSNIMVFVAITSCVDEDVSRGFADKVSNSTKQTKVFTVLAKEMRTNVGYLEPFGLDEMTKNIYGVNI